MLSEPVPTQTAPAMRAANEAAEQAISDWLYPELWSVSDQRRFAESMVNAIAPLIRAQTLADVQKAIKEANERHIEPTPEYSQDFIDGYLMGKVASLRVVQVL